jgi:hypothetical protein
MAAALSSSSSFALRTTVNSYLFMLLYLLVVSGPCFQ